MNDARISRPAVTAWSRNHTPRFMARIANRVVNGASIRCNVDTGLLRSSLTSEVLYGGMGRRVGSHVNYARWVHEGTAPHPINASPGPGRRTAWRHLKFRGRDGTWVFRRRVFHPGYKGNPFLWDATVEVFAVLGRR